MTREEAKALLESRRDLIKSDYPKIDDYREALEIAIKALEQKPCEDCISRQAAIDIVNKYKKSQMVLWGKPMVGAASIVIELEELPPAQPETHDKRAEMHACDLISRQAAIDALHMHLMYRMGTDSNKKRLDEWINNLPSAQPERTCVNCGRTANKGGWFADGRTRCPIEEHYALPKDGFCHLWEKRNVTDDDYPERRTDEQ